MFVEPWMCVVIARRITS